MRSSLDRIAHYGRLINNFQKKQRLFTSVVDAAELSPINKYTVRSHTCGQLSNRDVGQRVSLCGWVQYTRFDNKIILLKDSYGVIQCVADKNYWSECLKKLTLHNESVVQVDGYIKERPDGQKNCRMSTGEVELHIEQLNVLSSARKDLPILSREEVASSPVTHVNRLKHRYLDLRSSYMQHALRFRSSVCKILRDKLYQLNFVECETPTLFGRTPGGANEFVVPTQIPNKFYSLVQSPQQLKQLLMIGGIDRYFQICRCYRDEAGRTDRQPEFTQLDMELSFTNQDLVMRLVEELVYDLFVNICDEQVSIDVLTSSFKQNKRISTLSFSEAIMKYGTDKPDARFECFIQSGESDKLFVEFPFTLDQSTVINILEDAKARIGAENTIEPFFQCTDDMLRVEVNNHCQEAREFLGLVRLMIAQELDKTGKNIYKTRFELLWVTDFPLFSIDREGKLQSNHHPFTAPTPETVHLLDKNPLQVIGQHYDLVLNGQEVAGGSIRIHDAELQRRIFTEILKVGENTFAYFVEALSSGCPPHGGIAIGLDRLLSILLDRESIKDVIAFPKTNSGRELMTDCPQDLDSDVKLLYHI